MKRSFVYIILIFCSVNAVAQTHSHDHHFKKKFQEGNEYFEADDFKNAENAYMSVWKLDSMNEKLNLNLAICKFKLKEFPDSIMPYLLKVDKSKFAEAQLYEARVFHLEHKFDDAILHYNKYKTFAANERELNDNEIDRLIHMSEIAKHEMAQPHKAKIRNLGSVINSPFPDYVPLISADENIMYFTSRRPGSTGEQKDAWGKYYEDVYVSYKENGKWTKPKNIGNPINTETHDACVSLSGDAQQMFIYRTSIDLISGDLYLTKHDGDHWTKPEKLPHEINSEYRELSACTNLENSVIIFSSDKPGGLGGKDLYRSVRLPNGHWSKAVNLGPKINTAQDEDAPFIHANGRTLYYSSNGLNTMGGYDVFRTDINTEDWAFSDPEDLGYPINTVGDDIFFVVSADGKHGYYSSLNEDPKDPNYESEDIFYIDMRFGEHELKVRKAFLTEKGNDFLVAARVTVINEMTNKVEGIYNTHNGKFILAVNPYDKYKIVTEAKGYQSSTLILDPLIDLEDYNEDEDLVKLELKKE